MTPGRAPMAVSVSAEPKVAWLLPVRNGMPYLRETLESLAAQTRAGDEVLAWDDGSTDGSGDELRRWLPSRLPGRVVSSEAVTLGPALRELVKLAEAPLLARIDADDVALPDRLALQVEAMQRDKRLVLVGGQAGCVDAEGRRRDDWAQLPTRDRDCRWQVRFANPFMHPAVLFSREAALRAGNYAQTTRDQDLYLWTRMAPLGRMVNLSEKVIDYRLHDASVTATGRGRAEADRRRRRELLWPWMLPGLPRAQALRLLELLADPHDLDLTWAEVQALSDAARSAAEKCGERPTYFKHAGLYKRQRASLRTRWLKRRRWVSPVWPVAKAVRRLAPGQAA
ncbi:MAG: glycosyltransferase [Planctomycetota bacterium]